MFSLGGAACPYCSFVLSVVCLLLNPPLVGKVRNCLWKTLDDVISDACPGSPTKGSKTCSLKMRHLPWNIYKRKKKEEYFPLDVSLQCALSRNRNDSITNY